MIEICMVGHYFDYEVKDIVTLFFDEPISFVSSIPESNRNIFILSRLEEYEDKLEVYSKVSINEISFENEIKKENIPVAPLIKKRVSKRNVKLGLLNALQSATGKQIPWGTLTGIRPTKIIKELEDRGYDKNAVIDSLQKEFGVAKSKAELMVEITGIERKFTHQVMPELFSIYIGIPFCPDRCLYCSFPSSPVKQYAKIIDTFMDTLVKEISVVGELVLKNGWKLETIYVGGGTPTSLNHKQLAKLLECLNKTFALGAVKEITVEAGRPDTLDVEKVKVMKDYGVNRISINPQTMNEDTLRLVGRNHTVESINSAFELARNGGFDNINMDIIAGLPGENLEKFKNTLERVKQLKPDSLTVHTLALKKGSKLIMEKEKYILPSDSVVEDMLQECRYEAVGAGMIPYYMYRQKNMLGLQENIGYCMPGKECIYNIKMIEEVQNILAFGPGGVSRVMDFESRAIEKIFNDRSIEGYIARIDEMIERKTKAIKNKA